MPGPDSIVSAVLDALAFQRPRDAVTGLLTTLMQRHPELSVGLMLRRGDRIFLHTRAPDATSRAVLAHRFLHSQVSLFGNHELDTVGLEAPETGGRAIPATRSPTVHVIDLDGDPVGELSLYPEHAQGAEWATAFALVLKHFQLLQESGIRDYVTGLYGRGHAEAMLTRALELHRRHRIPLTFGLLDVDSFKAINDTLGHAAGDDVLRMIGRTLERNSRISDTIARYGGDEFSVLLQHITAANARRVSARLHEQLTFPASGHHTAAIRISGGWIHVPADAETPVQDDLVHHADGLLYKAKHGLNGTGLFEVLGETSGPAGLDQIL